MKPVRGKTGHIFFMCHVEGYDVLGYHAFIKGVNVVNKKYTSCRNGFDQEFEFV